MGVATLVRSDLIGPWIISIGFKQEFVPAIVIMPNLTSACPKPITYIALNRLAFNFCGVHSFYDAQV